MADLQPGFYHLTSKEEPEPLLVHGYHCTDMDGAFVFGFNTHDGGGLLPLSDVMDSTKITAVTISEKETCPCGRSDGPFCTNKCIAGELK